MEVKDLVRVFVKGGIISPGEFLKIILTAEKLGAPHIHLGSRQDVLLPVTVTDTAVLDEAFASIGTEYEVNTFYYQNILSSYVAQDIMPDKKWLASHIYNQILDSFDFRTTLRINLVDPLQSLVPLFTGQINFIASNQENYWYVYLRFEDLQLAPWQFPLLVYSDDLYKIGRALEVLRQEKPAFTYQEIYTWLSDNVSINTQPVTEDLLLPETNFSYYEGINRSLDDKYWLGLYWRDNAYTIAKLKPIMERCIETELGSISFTPWKSLVIKGIFEKDRLGWEKLMGRFGLNLRHSSLELNWHLPALDQEALALKTYLVRELDQRDVSTYGLTFTIKHSEDITLFTSIVIERVGSDSDTYNLLFSKNFNPNLGAYQAYASAVHKSTLPALIMELSLVYFDSLQEDVVFSPQVKAITDGIQKEIYQCRHCQTIYDPDYGDPEASVEPDTPFALVPDSYSCPMCGSAKSGFERMRIDQKVG